MPPATAFHARSDALRLLYLVAFARQPRRFPAGSVVRYDAQAVHSASSPERKMRITYTKRILEDVNMHTSPHALDNAY